MKRAQLNLWQPKRRRFRWLPPTERPGRLQRKGAHPDVNIPPHDETKWPRWWSDSRRCIKRFTMYRCDLCGYGTRRRGSPPAYCYHCGYSIERMICCVPVKSRGRRRKLVRTRADFKRPEPQKWLLAVPPFGVVNSSDPFEDELPHEQSW